MEIAQVAGACLVAAVLAVIVRAQKPEIAMQIAIITGILVFAFLLTRIAYIISAIGGLVSRAQGGGIYLGAVLKVIGVSYVAGFAADVCRDAGEGAIASKVEFAGKVVIMIIALPIMVAVLETVLRLIP